MATFNKFNCFIGDVGLKIHDLNADVFKVYLTNEQPLAADTVKGDIAEIAGGNGYTAGGADIQAAYSQSGGLGTMTAVDVLWTASGAVGPFRWAVVYNDTSATDALVCWWEYAAASISLANLETFAVDFGASLLTLQ